MRRLSSRLPPTHARHFSTSACWRQIQHEHELWSQHGLPAAPAIQGVAKKAPADLTHTAVDAGLGTDHRVDPYTRTLPNFELRAPESTVRTSVELHCKPEANQYAPLSSWFGEEKLMVKYLESLRLPELPIPTAWTNQLEEFETQLLPEYCAENAKDLTMERAQWAALKKKFEEPLSQTTIFDRAQFVEKVERLLPRVTEHLSGSHKAVLEDVSQLYQRRAVHEWNQRIDTLKSFTLRASSIPGFDVWGTMFARVEEQYTTLFPGPLAVSSPQPHLHPSTSNLEALWNEVSGAPVPDVKPAVALLFLTTLVGKHDATMKHLSEMIVRQSSSSFSASIEEQSGFIKQHAVWLLQQDVHLLNACRAAGWAESEVTPIATLIALRRINVDDPQLFNATAAIFAIDEIGSRQVVNRLINSTNAKAKAHALALFEINFDSTDELGVGDRTSKITAAFTRKKWRQNGRTIALDLLGDRDTAKEIRAIIDQDVAGAKFKKAKDAVLSVTTSEMIEELGRARSFHDDKVSQALRDAITSLLSMSPPRVLEVMSECGVDISPLQASKGPSGARQTHRSVNIDVSMKSAIRAEVARVHPKWKSQKVLSESAPADDVQELNELLRIYTRLTAVPHVAKAVMKSRYRRREGNIGFAEHEHNIPVEFGHAQHYDNIQYKQYDWAGWYQRMWDVTLRNVSLRVRMSDLRGAISNDGCPFLDLQSERRLRIVAGERVGSSVIKLDVDRFEDKGDNKEHGMLKLQELMAESRKAILGKEYWPSVEVKVRRPSGQSKMRYSLIDWDRIEKLSQENYKKYRQLKSQAVFVSPTQTWLQESEQNPDNLFDALSS